MSQRLDAILKRLDRYEARLDVARKQLKRQLDQLVDQRIDQLKQDVAQIREYILRGRDPAWDRDDQLANELVPQGLAVDSQEYLADAARERNQEEFASSSGGSVFTQSRKRSRGKQTRSRSKPKKAHTSSTNRTEEDTGESGFFKINTISLQCTQKDCQFSTETKVELRKHLKSIHKLDPFLCPIAACGQRFKTMYITLSA